MQLLWTAADERRLCSEAARAGARSAFQQPSLEAAGVCSAAAQQARSLEPLETGAELEWQGGWLGGWSTHHSLLSYSQRAGSSAAATAANEARHVVRAKLSGAELPATLPPAAAAQPEAAAAAELPPAAAEVESAGISEAPLPHEPPAPAETNAGSEAAEVSEAAEEMAALPARCREEAKEATPQRHTDMLLRRPSSVRRRAHCLLQRTALQMAAPGPRASLPQGVPLTTSASRVRAPREAESASRVRAPREAESRRGIAGPVAGSAAGMSAVTSLEWFRERGSGVRLRHPAASGVCRFTRSGRHSSAAEQPPRASERASPSEQPPHAHELTGRAPSVFAVQGLSSGAATVRKLEFERMLLRQRQLPSQTPTPSESAKLHRLKFEQLLQRQRDASTA